MFMRFTSAIVVLVALLFGGSITSNVLAQKGEEHCVLRLDEDSSNRARCFNTISEAISFATEGRVNLTSDINAGDITEKLLDQGPNRNRERTQSTMQTTTVIGIIYAREDYNGQSYTFTFRGGCNAAPEIQAPTVQANWNDRASSSRGFGDCRTMRHYEDGRFGGAVRDCTSDCPRLGVLKKATSSLKWFR